MYHREFTEARVKEPEPRDETDALTDGEEERCFRASTASNRMRYFDRRAVAPLGSLLLEHSPV